MIPMLPMLRDWIARKTLRHRHWAVKKITPNLYFDAFRDRGVLVPRPMTLFLKEKLTEPLVGAEIGVGEAINALSLLKTLDMKHLYLIDPYVPYFEINGVVDYHNEDEWRMVTKKLERYSDKVSLLRMTSDDAVSHLPDGLDFVYVDGNHAGRQVEKDIRNYWPKVRLGGVMGGHDFKRPDFEGLVNAVIRFVVEQDLVLKGELMDFWFVKSC